MKIVLCLLTRNERQSVEIVFPKLPIPGKNAGFDDVFVIDGNSNDGTPEYFRAKGITVLQQTRRGRGDAYLTAFDKIDADAYLFFSPDGNEASTDLNKFRPLLENGADLVIASRMMKGGVNEEDHKVFKWRKWTNLAFNLLANIVFRKRGPYVTDSINGYRAITKLAVEKLKLDAQFYTIEYQMTIRAMAQGLNIQEFPTCEGERVAGTTGAPSIPTGLAFIKCFFKEINHHFFCKQ